MDRVIVCNPQMERSALASGVVCPISVVPVPCDVERYQRSYKVPDAIKRLKDQGKFVFYFVGEMVRRKNLQGLLKTFHTEFEPSENVALVIKTTKPGLPAPETHKHALAFCDKIK